MIISQNDKLLKIIRIVGVNLIPVFGTIIFDWSIFEVVLTYLIETGVFFVISYIDHFFIKKKDALSTLMDLIQLISSLLFLSLILLMLTTFVFYMTERHSEDFGEMMKVMTKRVAAFELGYVIIAIFSFNFIYYLITKNTAKKNKNISLWKSFEKIFYIYVFICISAIIYGILPSNEIVGISLIILAKIIVDFLLQKNNDDSIKKSQKLKN